MPHSTCSALTPWIESLILRHGSQEEGSSKLLKANVIGTGHMSPSQAQDFDSPMGLLFLSDGVLQIPAVLTAAAWELLQDQEERENLTSMLHTKVHVRGYRLQFHMAAEQSKCRFFLSVKELTTISVGPHKDNTPCCMTLPSVMQKICQMWRTMQEQDVSECEDSQSALDLTELLGEWQLDCMQSALEDVKERIMEVQGRSSGCTSPLDSVGTRWDADRVRYKGDGPFIVPPKCLLIPEEVALQPSVCNQASDSEVPGGSAPADRDSAQASVEAASWRIGELPVLQTGPSTSQGSHLFTEEKIQRDVRIGELADNTLRPLSPTWDSFSLPRPTSSSSEVSALETVPTEFRPDLPGFDCSTQVPSDHLKQFENASDLGKEKSSFLTPYQKAMGFPSSTVPAVSLPSGKTSGSPNQLPATQERRQHAAQEHPPLDQGNPNLDLGTEERKGRKAKRKRDEFPLPPVSNEENILLSLSPPSWLFDTLAGSTSTQEDNEHQRASGLRWASAKTPGVHSDGTPFSYSYSVSGQNLVDLSRFKVTGLSLQWAIRYLLVPKESENRLHT